MIFCTLFDSNYLDKGLVLYQSLEEVSSDFKLYVLPMDEKCAAVLEDMTLNHLQLVSFNRFLQDEELEDIKNQRSKAEFCWTCSSHLLDYVIRFCKENICTYIDSDLYFYADPQVLIDEMQDKDVQIIEHRFPNTYDGRSYLKHSGRFCVEFNTFKNTPASIELLTWWKEQCRNSCSAHSAKEEVFGDQKYLDAFVNHTNVTIVQHLGAGVAPWNVNQYQLVSTQPIMVKEKGSKKTTPLIFYHFHNINDVNENSVNINVYQRFNGVDDNLINFLYTAYLARIAQARRMLTQKYGVNNDIKMHPSFEQPISKSEQIKSIFKQMNQKPYTEKIPYLWSNISYVLRVQRQGKKNIRRLNVPRG